MSSALSDITLAWQIKTPLRQEILSQVTRDFYPLRQVACMHKLAFFYSIA